MPAFFSTHPVGEQRIENLKRHMPKAPVPNPDWQPRKK
jgi:predicted Zn-dependent protease